MKYTFHFARGNHINFWKHSCDVNGEFSRSQIVLYSNGNSIWCDKNLSTINYTICFNVCISVCYRQTSVEWKIVLKKPLNQVWKSHTWHRCLIVSVLCKVSIVKISNSPYQLVIKKVFRVWSFSHSTFFLYKSTYTGYYNNFLLSSKFMGEVGHISTLCIILL